MFHRKSEAGQDRDAETVIALHSQQQNMSYIPPVYLKNGINQKRVCTNLGCCFLFLLTMGAFGYFYFLTYTKQHVESLYTPVDSDGHACGLGNLKQFPLIYFVTPNPKYLSRTLCVSQCPMQSDKILKCSPNSVVKSCSPDPSPTDPSKQILIYDSYVYGNTLCLPSDPNYQQAIDQAIVVGDVQQAVYTFELSINIIIMSAGIALGLALLFTILLGLITTCVTWIFLLMYIGTTGALSFYFLLCFLGSQPYISLITPYEDQVKQQQQFVMNFYIFGLSLIFGLMSAYAFFNVCWNFTKMKFMISLIKLATKFFYRNKSTIFVPTLFFFLILATIGIWLASSVFILSENIPQKRDTPFPQIYVTFDSFIKLFLSFVGMIWLRSYLLSFSRFLNVSIATLWYFSANRDQSLNSLLLSQSFKMACRYHNGSIIAEAIYDFLFSGLSSLFNAIYPTLNKYRLKRHSPCFHYTASCLLCLCCCCESFIMYINSYAFVQIIMTSQDYMEASKAVHYTIQRNYQDFDTLSELGDTFTHFSKMFIFLTSTIFSYLFMINSPTYHQLITHPIYTLLLMGFLTLSIATLFMDMLGQTADALILAYFTDCEVEKFHFGRDESGSCPDDIRETVKHIREKRKLYYG